MSRVSGSEGLATSSGQGLRDIRKLLLEMSFPPDESTVQRAQDALGYTFKQPHLLQQALLHSSLGGVNNVRLSWLGNDILGLLAAYDGFHGMPYASRKELHAKREKCNSKQSCQEAADRLGLTALLQRSPGQQQAMSNATKADVFMAVLAAVFVDSGGNSLEAVQKVFAVSIGGMKVEGEFERSVASNPPHLNSTSTMLQQGTKPAFTVPSLAALNPTSPHTPPEKGSRVGVAHAEVEESSDVEI